MRVYDQGSGYRVEVSADDVRDFKSRWPASGLPTRAMWFEFDKKNGDLVDTNAPETGEGSALVALSEDAQKYGERKLKGRGGFGGAGRRTTAKACKVGGAGCGGFLRYLERDLIPDTEESRGADSGMAKDLRALAMFLKGAHYATAAGIRYSREDFIDYLQETLIPDLEESDSPYAEDFETGLKFLRRG